MTMDTLASAQTKIDSLLAFDEAERLSALRRLRLLDTPPSPSFDRVTRLAAMALRVPIVLVSLVDESRQWFKSRFGIDAIETSREISFCTHAVANRDILVVPDARRDPRFAKNPLVTQDPKIRFYAGVPLFTRDGHAIGTLCAIDRRPRDLNGEATETLQDLASITQDLIQAHDAAVQMNGLDFAAERERLLNETIDAVPVGIIFASPSGQLRRANVRACELLGLEPKEPPRKTIAEIMHPVDWDTHGDSIRSVAAGVLDSYRLRARLQQQNGRYFDSLVTVSLKRLLSGCAAYLLLIVDTSGDRAGL